MNSIMVNINRMLILLLLLTGFNVMAEQVPFRVIETESLNIKLTKEGTGIVKNVYCEGCDFNIVKITKNSKASINGIDVNILQAKKLVDKVVMVSFDPETREVQYIRWSSSEK